MIFLFFSSSLARLEPELELFEVWEFGSWCHWRWWWFVARWSPQLQTVVTWVLDELERNQKKGKSSKYNFQDEWAPWFRSSCTSLVPGWHYIDLKNCQKSQFGGKIGENCLVKKWARTKTRLFLDSTGQNLFRTVEESWKSRTVWSQWSAKKYFFKTKFAHFSRPAETDPYVLKIHISESNVKY